MEQLVIIRTKPDLAKLIEYLKPFDFVAYDTETTGLGHDCLVIGLSVCAEENVAYYVILSEWIQPRIPVLETEEERMRREDIGLPTVTIPDPCIPGKLIELETRETINPLLELLKSKKLIMHNAVFDCSRTFNNFGIELIDALHTDTMELAHLLDENRRVGLKELAFTEFGESATEEQRIMKESVIANGGQLTKQNYELYKADADLIARYGAKDTILTLLLFYKMVPELFIQKLDDFFYEDESMPQLRGPTYTLNTSGLRVDASKLDKLEASLKLDCLRLHEEVLHGVHEYVKDLYPGINEKTTFNINSNQQLSWLLFIRLGAEFKKLTKAGKKHAETYGDNGKIPYHKAAKDRFIKAMQDAGLKPEKYLQCDKSVLLTLSLKYKWVAKLLEYKKADKLLKTYVIGIKDRMKYGIIHPSFLQHGTTSGRYSSRDPNFQNLPRDEKRVKECIIARDGKVFVGADYSQLEPRIFASFAKDAMLLLGFERNEDFYSVIGIPVFNKFDASGDKDSPEYFGLKYKILRDISKAIALSATYGTTAYKLADGLRDEEGRNFTPEQAQKILDDYFEHYPGVKQFMLDTHETVMKDGVVYNLFGRPRRIPDAKKIKRLFRNKKHHELQYVWRSLLNLAVNHCIQSSGASIINRAAIRFEQRMKELKINARLVLQVHDELVAECFEADQEIVAKELKHAMETIVELPGVKLIAEPKIGRTLAEIK